MADAVKGTVEEHAQHVLTKFNGEEDLRALIARSYMKQIGNFFKDKDKALSFLSGVISATQRNPKLLDCTPTSVINSFMKMAELRLMPSDVSGEAFVIPFNNKKKDGVQWVSVMEAQFQLGYKGLVTLFFRAGIKRIYADVIRENDKYSLINGELVHEIDMLKSKKDRGAWIGAYGRIILPSGEEAVKFMNREDILEHAKKFSKSYTTDKSPWKEENDPELWMPKKTVLIQMSKLVPKSDEIINAIGEDNKGSKIGEEKPAFNIEECEKKLLACETQDQLASAWAILPVEAKLELTDVKNEVKQRLATPAIEAPKEDVPMTPEEMAEIMAEDAKNNPQT